MNGQGRLSPDSSSPAGATSERPEPQLRARIDSILAVVAGALLILWLVLDGSAWR